MKYTIRANNKKVILLSHFGGINLPIQHDKENINAPVCLYIRCG